MTKEEFEKDWAVGAKMTIEQVQEYGMTAVPCTCGEDGCKGWQMVADLSEVVEEANRRLFEHLADPNRGPLKLEIYKGSRATGDS